MNNSWTIGATWKILVPSNRQCNHKKLNRRCLIRSTTWKESNVNCEAPLFQLWGWLMPYVRLMLKIHKGRYTWFITSDVFGQSNSWNLSTCFSDSFNKNSAAFFIISSSKLTYRNDKMTSFQYWRPFYRRRFCFQKDKEMKKLIKATQSLASATEFGLKRSFVIGQWYLVYLFLSNRLRPLGFILNSLNGAYGFFFVSY